MMTYFLERLSQQVEHFNKQIVKVWNKWEPGKCGVPEEGWNPTWQEAGKNSKPEIYDWEFCVSTWTRLLHNSYQTGQDTVPE